MKNWNLNLSMRCWIIGSFKENGCGILFRKLKYNILGRAPHFGGELFSIYSGTFAGVMPNGEQLAAMGLTQAQARLLLGR